MSDKEFPSCAYDVCAEFDCEETMALALIAIRNELDRTRKALNIAVDMLNLVYKGNGDPQDIMRYKDNLWTSVRTLCKQALEQITALEQKDE